MVVQMTKEQSNHLIAAVTGRAGGGGRVATAAVMGQLLQCKLGKDRIKRIHNFEDWIKDAESKMKVLKMMRNKEKKDFLRTQTRHAFGSEEGRRPGQMSCTLLSNPKFKPSSNIF